ncbi:ADP-ribose pyrophosphatase, mitochondrial-like [Lingula anatina]|uniref:ADP-ribose pyrophosphatase, mitochondrial-like n=1 Tax=Lingula anatina TaxID=7574 RepID=A0A2R2MQM8_LINAN|nr:ADP-ribose pyrophosphatase, mitochondrial-like [Lingula anatina]|eukprot:XP_023932559.1 ADP-ribose pyrophosphatase, mitochondrial-like [Lingula anatina]
MGNSNSTTTMTSVPKPNSHYKCRNCQYPRGGPQRYAVPDDKVSWKTNYPEYAPPEFTSESVSSGPVWADPGVTEKGPPPLKWNTVHGKVNRVSHMGQYEVVNGLPQNPVGRTGIRSRGHLGRWGPNHAADPIVTRWKRDKNGSKVIHPTTKKPILQFVAIQRKDSGEWAIPGGMVDAGERVSVTLKREFAEEAMNSLEANSEEKEKIKKSLETLFSKGVEVIKGPVWKRDKNGSKVIHPTTKKPILQFVAIQRKDSGEWAIPGGMVDAGERVSVTLKREFAEEAMNSLEANSEEKEKIKKSLETLFSKGVEVYRGYVDDPRNTDNVWMETVAYNFHDDTGDSVGKFNLNAGDDAGNVKWTDISSSLQLFASHVDFIEKVAKKNNAHW